LRGAKNSPMPNLYVPTAKERRDTMPGEQKHAWYTPNSFIPEV